jgi:transketolase
MMEGVSHEAASLAGHLGLNNLIYFYDDNHITIEGNTELAFSDDVGKRFEAYHWSVQRIDGHDRPAIESALQNALAEREQPSLIIARTHIGFGSPNKQDTADIHGAAIGPEETAATKKNLGWPPEPTFLVPDEVRPLCARRAEEGKALHAEWQRRFDEFRRSEPQAAAQWDKMMNRETPADLMEKLLASTRCEAMATRKASGHVLQVAAELVPSLVGGSADLAPSTNTLLKKYPSIARGRFEGRNFHFGVREHGMGGILNGLALYGGFLPYGATFLVFADYMRPPIRLAAIMGARVIYVFTHDTILVGEDGPTHQAVEQIASLRLIPNLNVIRPADWPETAAAWAMALERQDGPTALILTRQNVPAIDRTKTAPASLLRHGAYIVSEASKSPPDLLLISCGSELPLAMEAQGKLQGMGIAARVVSMPSMRLFDAQPQHYKDEVLPPSCRERVAIETAVSFGWHKYIGSDGLALCLDRFGVSGPYKKLVEHFGFTCDKIVESILAWQKHRTGRM